MRLPYLVTLSLSISPSPPLSSHALIILNNKTHRMLIKYSHPNTLYTQFFSPGIGLGQPPDLGGLFIMSRLVYSERITCTFSDMCIF